MRPVESVIKSNSNALLIKSAARLWVYPSNVVVDVTYGKGLWYLAMNELRVARSLAMWAHDKYTLDGTDFTKLPEVSDSVDVIFFDPPYTAKGGRETSGIVGFDEAYGLKDAPSTPEELDLLIKQGMIEIRRVLKTGGRVFVKTSDYISSGKFHTAHHNLVDAAKNMGFEQVDEFIFLGGTGPQPKENPDGTPRRQIHSRRAHSFLCIFQKGRHVPT